MPYRDPWRDAIREARRLLYVGRTPEQACKQTGLPMSVIDRIAPPILKEVGEREAIRDAERMLEQEHERILAERYPCPLCHKGHGVASGNTAFAYPKGFLRRLEPDDHNEGRALFRPWFARCSNRRCVARLMFPRDTEQDALNAFTLGEWVEPHPFHSIDDGSEWTWTNQGLACEVAAMLRDHTAEQVKRLGFNPIAVDEIANRRALLIARRAPWKAFDTTLMCPKCGAQGRYRKAVNPITHARTASDCWWRVGCPRCGARTANAFPTKAQAETVFENGDLDAKPEEGKTCG